MKIRINGKDYQLAVEETKKNKFKVCLEGKGYFVEIDPYELERLSSLEEESAEEVTEKTLRAPFPGVISQVNVDQGTNVQKNQVLLILASMKMENEIISSMSGVVQKIFIKKDQEVKEGQELLSLKAEGSKKGSS